MYGGSYGDDATKVFIELCEMVDEAIETLEEAGTPAGGSGARKHEKTDG